MLRADEAKRLIATKDEYDAQYFRVRGLVYDGLLTEGVSDEINERHGLIQKPMHRWQHNLFMCLRKVSTRTQAIINKVDGKRMCIANSCLNVGCSNVQKAVRVLATNGPHTYASMQQHFVNKRTR